MVTAQVPVPTLMEHVTIRFFFRFLPDPLLATPGLHAPRFTILPLVAVIAYVTPVTGVMVPTSRRVDRV